MINLDVSKITEVDTDALEEKLQNRMKILVRFSLSKHNLSLKFFYLVCQTTQN